MPQDIREAFLKMIKQVFDELESKRKIENELKEKENQLSFHEYYKETLEKDYQRLCNELNEKISKVDELKRQLNDNDYVLYNLNERLRKLESELKMYKKENMSLKEQLRESEAQKKEGFVSKIKSYMGN